LPMRKKKIADGKMTSDAYAELLDGEETSQAESLSLKPALCSMTTD
jgi:hypothetical protein